MTFKYDNVYINETGTVTGPYEANGPISKYFDKSYKDFYMGLPTWEQAESKLIQDAVDIVLNKTDRTKFDIDLFISGDLLNQISASGKQAFENSLYCKHYFCPPTNKLIIFHYECSI